MKHSHHTSSIQTARTFISGFVSCLDVLVSACIEQRSMRNLDLHICGHTLFGPAFIFTIHNSEGTPVRVLCVDGAFQSATYLDDRRFEPVFSYYKAFDLLFDVHPTPHVLMIGGAGCSWPKHAVTHHKDVTVDVVEIDPVIVDISHTYFFVHDVDPQRLHLITQNGVRYLAETHQCYDVIINDAFTGNNPESAFAQPEVLTSIATHLTKRGLYLINVVTPVSSPDEAQAATETFAQLSEITETLHDTFSTVLVMPCIDDEYAGEGNYLIIASNDDSVATVYPSALRYQDLHA